jgi:1-acyl-sn-glycerol-3-phosphate acyltransferase
MERLTRLLLELLRPLFMGFWRGILGWKVDNGLPDVPKIVIPAVPHTSNWDYLHALLGAYYMRRRLNVTVKQELFFPPLGWILRALGGVPINRSKSTNFVDQTTQRFDESDRMVMIFTPEGSRSKTEYWRTGFYWVAHQANIPIVIAAINYKDKCLYMSEPIYPTGDIYADFEQIKAHTAQYGHALYRDKTSTIALRPPKPDESAETVA